MSARGLWGARYSIRCEGEARVFGDIQRLRGVFSRHKEMREAKKPAVLQRNQQRPVFHSTMMKARDKMLLMCLVCVWLCVNQSEMAGRWRLSCYQLPPRSNLAAPERDFGQISFPPTRFLRSASHSNFARLDINNVNVLPHIAVISIAATYRPSSVMNIRDLKCYTSTL
jgi:hypothetical protein